MSERSTVGLDLAHRYAKEFLSGLDERSVASTVDVTTLRDHLGGPVPEVGEEPAAVIEHMVAAIDGGILGSTSGRFFAWVIGGSLEAALAADWLTSTWDQNAALSPCSPAAAVVEEIAGAWLLDLLALPRDASFAFTTGCQMAHFTSLAAARNAVLRAHDWDVNLDGLQGAPAVRVLTSTQRHGSVDRALRFLGFGSRHLTTIETNEFGQCDIETLRNALAGGNGPTIVILKAGDINIAAFDDFNRAIPLAKEHGAWVHVDGAFGLFARISSQYCSLTAGIELADSWVTDGHKWLNVPFDCGFAVIRDTRAHRESMSIGASYISTDAATRDQIDWNPEWSRRARGFPVYAALRQLGRGGLEDLINRNCAQACKLVDGIGEHSGANVLWRPTLNQGLVRFLDTRPDAGAADHDRRTERIIQMVNASGEAFFSGTTWRERRAMRISVVNAHTADADIHRSVVAVCEAVDHCIREDARNS